MERIWLKSYSAGVPAEVDVGAYRSIVDILERSVAKFWDKPAFIQMGATLTYAEVDRLSRDFAAYLSEELKLEKGARVALMMLNILQYPIALLGALRAGYVVVNCNPLYTARELERQLADSGAEAVVIIENFASVLQEALPRTAIKHVITTRIGDMLSWGRGALVNFVIKYVKGLVPAWSIPGAVEFRTALRRGANLAWTGPSIEPDDIAFLQYTGGTTGVPKGAMLLHRNIVANLQQHHAHLHAVLGEGRDVVITAIPLFHIYALTVSCLLAIKIGAINVLIVNPRDISGLVKELKKHRFTCFPGVNTLFRALLDNPEFARLDFSSLSIAASGGSALQKAVATKWKAITGKTLIEAYGLTETSPVVTCNPTDLIEFNGSCGVPIPSTEVAIKDDHGADLPIGEAGELCARGPQVMKAYWKKPEETAKIMTSDGFLRTGDIATMDENGFVRIVDRKKDMINVSGFKVYPNEVEEVVSMHAGVRDVGAVGVPDPVSGEAVKVIVVRRDPSLTETELRTYCRKYLTSYKVPQIIEFRDELPKTNLGKILRRALRD
ncbi:MAG: AMP-binding protein [Alphaproteobacteria bacterium]|nr:AMP-binding protein [Alphaproteobacteria bacterium]MBM3651892.1 AMP-binding protein [Alphaproteobacteria bacterium]